MNVRLNSLSLSLSLSRTHTHTNTPRAHTHQNLLILLILVVCFSISVLFVGACSVLATVVLELSPCVEFEFHVVVPTSSVQA